MNIEVAVHDDHKLLSLMILYMVTFAFIGFGYFVVFELLDKVSV